MECKVLKRVRKKHKIGILVIKKVDERGNPIKPDCECIDCRSGRPRVINKEEHKKFVNNMLSIVN